MKKILYWVNEHIWYKHFFENGNQIYHIVGVKGIRTFLVDGPGGQRSTMTPLIKMWKKLI
jgi:hypothetical protein